MRYFNPRSPCGERPLKPAISFCVIAISIHAPRVGSDQLLLSLVRLLAIFQSTLPVWGATCYAGYVAGCDYGFQSTLPVWGATWISSPGSLMIPYFNPRSPCGERPGIMTTARYLQDDFNPRSPCGERPLHLVSEPAYTPYFNPRSPCGERPRTTLRCTCSTGKFQSTLPVWGATTRHRPRGGER